MEVTDTTEVTQVTVEELTALGDLFTQRNELAGRAERIKHEHEAAIVSFMDEVKEYADEEDWCGVFDRTVTDLGYPEAARNETVIWESQVDLLIDISAEQWFDNYARTECVSGDTVEAGIRVEVSGAKEGVRGECICSDVTEEEIREAVREKYGTSFDFKVDDTDTTCDNE